MAPSGLSPVPRKRRKPEHELSTNRNTRKTHKRLNEMPPDVRDLFLAKNAFRFTQQRDKRKLESSDAYINADEETQATMVEECRKEVDARYIAKGRHPEFMDRNVTEGEAAQIAAAVNSLEWEDVADTRAGDSAQLNLTNLSLRLQEQKNQFTAVEKSEMDLQRLVLRIKRKKRRALRQLRHSIKCLTNLYTEMKAFNP
ncbi:hypothetical protein G7046_g3104 [Stylonectria norvegica]|nr:hypothetical protein G7046_g3104 [Stylonectria norvegica]